MDFLSSFVGNLFNKSLDQIKQQQQLLLKKWKQTKSKEDYNEYIKIKKVRKQKQQGQKKTNIQPQIKIKQLNLQRQPTSQPKQGNLIDSLVSFGKNVAKPTLDYTANLLKQNAQTAGSLMTLYNDYKKGVTPVQALTNAKKAQIAIRKQWNPTIWDNIQYGSQTVADTRPGKFFINNLGQAGQIIKDGAMMKLNQYVKSNIIPLNQQLQKIKIEKQLLKQKLNLEKEKQDLKQEKRKLQKRKIIERLQQKMIQEQQNQNQNQILQNYIQRQNPLKIFKRKKQIRSIKKYDQYSKMPQMINVKNRKRFRLNDLNKFYK